MRKCDRQPRIILLNVVCRWGSTMMRALDHYGSTGSVRPRPADGTMLLHTIGVEEFRARTRSCEGTVAADHIDRRVAGPVAALPP
ncbi:hypothetical protein [Nocardia sp. NBC_01388]|uniref:hypothetical protein n=1 Tax=Nocardia sp. NBC_01388 TaxID=2903596 RepID=UPI00386A3B3F